MFHATDGFPKLRKAITPNRQEFTCGSMRGTRIAGPVEGKLGRSRDESARCGQGRECVGSSWRRVRKKAEPVWVRPETCTREHSIVTRS
jgi:hypothetical protein